MVASPLHGSGIIIMTACGSERPDSTSSSSTLSNIAESLPLWSMIGRIFFMSSPNRSAGEQALAGRHPVDVAAQRVDLAVVGDVAVRMGARPGGKRVRAEARVDQRQRRLHERIVQVREEAIALDRRIEHALVDERLARQARNVEHAALGDSRVAHRRSRRAGG